jgi:hypothetical protein
MRRLAFPAISLVVVLGVVSAAPADDCLPLLKGFTAGAKISMVSINDRAVASWFEGELDYTAPLVRNGLMVRAAQLTTPPTGPTERPENSTAPPPDQVFSDRTAARTDLNGKAQPFNVGQPDHLEISMTITSKPAVVITLLNWGNVKHAFTASCDGGFMSGNGPGVRYVWKLSSR